jgi:hypothetical protein
MGRSGGRLMGVKEVLETYDLNVYTCLPTKSIKAN